MTTSAAPTPADSGPRRAAAPTSMFETLRRRPWTLLLIAAAVFCLVTSTWVYLTSDDSGLTVVDRADFQTDKGIQVTYTSITATRTVPQSYGDPLNAVQGTIFIVVDGEYDGTGSTASIGGCTPELVAANGMSWSTMIGASPPDRFSQLCEPGAQGLVRFMYLVPADQADQLIGLKLLDGDHFVLLRPFR